LRQFRSKNLAHNILKAQDLLTLVTHVRGIGWGENKRIQFAALAEVINSFSFDVSILWAHVLHSIPLQNKIQLFIFVRHEKFHQH
jgi:hypothetical protein